VLRLVTAILAGALIYIGALAGVVKVGNLQYKEDREVTLNAQKLLLTKEPQTDAIRQKIADIDWQLKKFSDADAILREQWKTMTANWKNANHEEFEKVATKLATVYTDRGNFDSAIEIHDVVLKYDKSVHGERSPEVARDYNNRALCLYLKGTTLEKNSDRKLYFENAIKTVRTSNAILENVKTDRAKFNVANNLKFEKLVQRDLDSLPR